ncbi:MAG TPA: DUF4864 domain-containing protein [Stellaceae bacterium]|nr:DUF4864 domain-containing protein [Stellaceae bacterium]
MQRKLVQLGSTAGYLGLAWILASPGIAGAQPWQPRDAEPPPGLPAAAGLTGAEAAAMRSLIEAQMTAMRTGDWSRAFALASPDLQAQYGTASALGDDVIAHYAPLPAVASVGFVDIVMFRGLPTFRVNLVDADGRVTTAYYLVRRLEDGSLRIAGCVLVRAPSS